MKLQDMNISARAMTRLTDFGVLTLADLLALSDADIREIVQFNSEAKVDRSGYASVIKALAEMNQPKPVKLTINPNAKLDESDDSLLPFNTETTGYPRAKRELPAGFKYAGELAGCRAKTSSGLVVLLGNVIGNFVQYWILNGIVANLPGAVSVNEPMMAA